MFSVLKLQTVDTAQTKCLHSAPGVTQLLLQLSANYWLSGSYDYRTLRHFHSILGQFVDYTSTVELCRSPKKVLITVFA